VSKVNFSNGFYFEGCILIYYVAYDDGSRDCRSMAHIYFFWQDHRSMAHHLFFLVMGVLYGHQNAPHYKKNALDVRKDGLSKMLIL
jgi:hypothetical protein